MKDFIIKNDKKFLREHIGDMSQLCGLKHYTLSEGRAKGVEAVDFKTGSGFDFTVLPGRGMDIAWASYKGTPVSYISKTGVVSPYSYESDKFLWLRNFFAGLLTTCGLSNAGGPCTVSDRLFGTMDHGLHGRISNTTAENVCVSEGWQGDNYVMSVSGRMRESILHGENLLLTREIKAVMGENKFILHDTVENQGVFDQPLTILYHMNIGYPILDEGTRLIINATSTTPNDDLARENLSNHKEMTSPTLGAFEHLYFHTLASAADGTTYVGVANDKLECGAYIKLNVNQFPYFTQWKQLSSQDYALGLEPGNCMPLGRAELEKRGLLDIVPSGDSREFEIEFGILADKDEIAEFEKLVASL
jgi:hypothetical protein